MSHPISRPVDQASLNATALDWAMSLTIKPIAHVATRSPATMLALRKAFRLTGAVLARTPRHVSIQPIAADHVRGEWVVAARAAQAERVVLYLHGGGYFFGSASNHRQITWRLSHTLARPVMSIDYRLAPRHSFEHARDDAVAAYCHLLDLGYRGEDILISGDSAGGHLTLVLLQTLRDRGLPRPACGICISPWTDLTGTSASIAANAGRDPYIAAPALKLLSRFLTRHHDPYDPLVSPLHGNFDGLPPLYVLVGSTEVLRDDSRHLARRARDAGVHVQHEEWHRMPHVFPIFASVLPEARSAFRHIARFVAEVEARVVRIAA